MRSRFHRVLVSVLKIAADIAATAGDAPTALQAVEKMAERFDVPGPKRTAETLLAAAGNATMTGQHKAVAEAALKIADAVAGAEEYALALDLCESAKASAQKARQYPLVKELAAKSDDFQKRQRAFQEYKAAWALMQDDPAQPAANLTAGRYQCFVKGDWAWGVPMLALGSDKALKDAALMELRQANSAEQQAAIGDAWWDVAETRQGEERNLLQLRAGLWYRQAEPKLGGLAALKIKQRLEELSKPAPAEEAQGQGDGGVQVVCEWQRFADSKPLPNLKLLSNGRIDNPSEPAVWCQRGKVLLTLWLAQKPPGSIFDMAVLSPEGTTYSATNSWGGRSSGRLLRGTNLVEKPYLRERAVRRANGRAGQGPAPGGTGQVVWGSLRVRHFKLQSSPSVVCAV